MTVPSTTMVQLVHDLTAAHPEARAVSADGVTDLIGGLTSREASVIAQVLMWLAIDERDGAAIESELNALAELAANDLLPVDVAAQVGLVAHERATGSAREHLDFLTSFARDAGTTRP